ncbi:reverse transcriptase family protein [Lysobacter antibioticus]|uniref:Reverse transcriptase family protein n=2 Tax=Lysobacter antibioticus TaxID=84531 RepID=A0A0S2F7F4_LYSAN|nr:reverse transcriptase family protein [Lysobacter antibioticus]
MAQRRLNSLLSRIELPDYLHSARKGRSYRTNAAAHSSAGRAIKVDIRQFYRSINDSYIHAFFRDVMECSPDVTHILTELASFERYLPTGSSLSPIVSFFAYWPMFDKLNSVASSVGAQMTVYVDDVVISGPGVSGSLIPICKRIMKDHGLRGHKVAYYHSGKTRVVTGVAVSPRGLSIPNKRLMKIRALRQEMDAAVDPATKALYKQAVLGQLREGSPLDPSFRTYSQAIERMA